MKIPKDQSDAYMEGWGARHKGRERLFVGAPNPDAIEAWYKGWDDCDRGAIDAKWALGPQFIESMSKVP